MTFSIPAPATASTHDEPQSTDYSAFQQDSQLPRRARSYSYQRSYSTTDRRRANSRFSIR